LSGLFYLALAFLAATAAIDTASSLAILAVSSAEAGEPCTSDSQCQGKLQCRCLAKNRGNYGLRICRSFPPFRLPADRVGLRCAAYLPRGASPLKKAPPVVWLGENIVDPRKVPQPQLSSSQETSSDDDRDPFLLYDWSTGKGTSLGSSGEQSNTEHHPQSYFYTRYASVCSSESEGHTDTVCQGLPILGTPGVSLAAMKEARRTVAHMVLQAPLNPKATIEGLSASKIRVVVGGGQSPKKAWHNNPEIQGRNSFKTGLGGGSPQFPSTGVELDDLCLPGSSEHRVYNALIEELFHSMQYTLMKPRQVCQYHHAYSSAVKNGLYEADKGLARERDGEPVPTVQADEYLASALHAWMGTDTRPEYKASAGNHASSTGREQLLSADPAAFCILAGMFRADDTWTPCLQAHPWKTHPNKSVKHDQAMCKDTLKRLEMEHGACPSDDVLWR